LELSAEQTAQPNFDNKEIKKTFIDFSEEWSKAFAKNKITVTFAILNR
jgi:hypothetical protein